MLGGCFITSASYVFKADLYEVARVRTKSGQIEDKWKFKKVIDCNFSTFSSTSFKAQAISEKFGATYEEMSYVLLYTAEDLGRASQITNIRDAQNNVIFKEIDLTDAPPTWYNVNGSAPSVDAFGRVYEWQTLLTRAEEQGEIDV